MKQDVSAAVKVAVLVVCLAAIGWSWQRSWQRKWLDCEAIGGSVDRLFDEVWQERNVMYESNGFELVTYEDESFQEIVRGTLRWAVRIGVYAEEFSEMCAQGAPGFTETRELRQRISALFSERLGSEDEPGPSYRLADTYYDRVQRQRVGPRWEDWGPR